MKKLNYNLCILIFLLPIFVKAGTKEIPFTLDDRDRLYYNFNNSPH